MAKKKPSKKPKNGVGGLIQGHSVIAAIVIALMLVLGFVGYNKYLDYQNVENMKQLLVDFEQLERDVEAETGEEFFIEANCGSVGKFATSYACSVYLRPINGETGSNFVEIAENYSANLMNEYGCIVASKGFRLENVNEDYVICSGFLVRGANEAKAEEIFYKYDTSPGSPL